MDSVISSFSSRRSTWYRLVIPLIRARIPSPSGVYRERFRRWGWAPPLLPPPAEGPADLLQYKQVDVPDKPRPLQLGDELIRSHHPVLVILVPDKGLGPRIRPLAISRLGLEVYVKMPLGKGLLQTPRRPAVPRPPFPFPWRCFSSWRASPAWWTIPWI